MSQEFVADKSGKKIDYYAFGSPLPNRNFSSSSYRFLGGVTDGKVLSETTAANGGVSISLFNMTMSGEKEVNYEDASENNTAKATTGVNGSLGIGFVMEYNIEVGAKITVKNDMPEE